MKTGIYILLICFVFSSRTFGSNVVELNTANIFETLNNNETWFVEFFTPGCSFCQAVEPQIEQLGDEVTSYEGIRVAKFNGDYSHGVLRTFGVTGFPTFFVIKDNKMYEYPRQDERTVENFLNFIRTDYLKEQELVIPTQLPVWEPFLQYSEDIINDTIAIFEQNVVAFALIIVGSLFASAIVTLTVFPFFLGYGPNPFSTPTVVLRPKTNTKTK